MAYYKKHRKKPINILEKEIRDKYLSMTLQSLSAAEEKLSIKKGKLLDETRSGWKLNNHGEWMAARDELRDIAEKESPPLEENILEIFSWGKLRRNRNITIEKRTQELWEEAIRDENSRAYKEWIIPLQKENEKREEWLNKQKEIREIELIEKAIPEIKKRIKKKEKDARLAAHEGTSRTQGESIVKKIKRQTSYPFECPYCMDLTSKDHGHVDHINPISNGGRSEEKNMILVCSDCNLSKSALSLRRFAITRGLDFEEICERLEQSGKWI